MNFILLTPGMLIIYGLIFAIVFILGIKLVPEHYFQIKENNLEHNYIIFSTVEKILFIPFTGMIVLITTGWTWYLITISAEIISKINS